MDTIWRGLDGIRPRLSWDGGKANMAKDPTSPEARPGAAKMFFVGKNDGKMLRKCWENVEKMGLSMGLSNDEMMGVNTLW